MDLLTPNPGTIFWTIIIFILLVVALKKIAWRPILQMVAEREKRIQEALEQADQAKIAADQLLSEQQQLLAAARIEAQEIITKSRQAAELTKEEIVKQAKAEADKLLTNAKREIDMSKEKALEEIRDLAVELSISATTKLIGKSLNESDHKALIDESIDQLGDLN